MPAPVDPERLCLSSPAQKTRSHSDPCYGATRVSRGNPPHVNVDHLVMRVAGQESTDPRMFNLIGVRIAKALKRKRATQNALADHCELTPSSVSGWTTGRAMPADDLLPRVAAFLDVPPHYLVALDPKIRPQNVKRTEPLAIAIERYRASRPKWKDIAKYLSSKAAS